MSSSFVFFFFLGNGCGTDVLGGEGGTGSKSTGSDARSSKTGAEQFFAGGDGEVGMGMGMGMGKTEIVAYFRPFL